MRLLDFFCRFVTGASVGLLGLILVDMLVCPGIICNCPDFFCNSDRILLGCGLLAGAFGTIIFPGACDA
jgi:hypothetical protein